VLETGATCSLVVVVAAPDEGVISVLEDSDFTSSQIAGDQDSTLSIVNTENAANVAKRIILVISKPPNEKLIGRVTLKPAALVKPKETYLF